MQCKYYHIESSIENTSISIQIIKGNVKKRGENIIVLKLLCQFLTYKFALFFIILFLFRNGPNNSISSGGLPSRSSSAATVQRSVKVNMGTSYNKRLDSIHKVANAYEEMGRRLEEELRESNIKSRKERVEEMKSGYNLMGEKKQRKWLIKHGKGHVLQFTDE